MDRKSHTQRERVGYRSTALTKETSCGFKRKKMR